MPGAWGGNLLGRPEGLMASTGMIIDGVLGSQCVDSSGEILDIEGADISDLEEGRGVLNYEHRDDAGNGQEIVGRILTAKKIFKEGDCDNDRQRAFWKKVKHPFIYGVCRLYDGAGHEGAKALAAQIRDHHANGEPILVRFSVEGSTLEKEGNTLKRSVIRKVALTLKPCNRTADSGLIEDPNAPTGFDKKPVQRVGDILTGLSDDAKKTEHQHPLYQKLGGVYETEYVAFEESDHRNLVKALVKLKAVKKALSAMGGDAAPSALSGHAALQREDIIRFRPKAMKTLKSYLDKNDDFDRTKLVAALKHELPEASDAFIDHFADIANDYHVKLRKDEHPLGPAVTNLNNPHPELRPEAHPEQVEVDRSKEAPGSRPSKIKGGLSMETGGQLTLPRPGKRVAGQKKRPLKLQQHFPNDDIYDGLLNPDKALADGRLSDEQYHHIIKTIHEPWHRAMSNWLPLNKAMSEGKIPKSVMAKAVIFAAMSPNTSVPMQERYYGHYMDMLHEGLVDPFRPISEKAIENFTTRSISGEHPKWNRAFYANQGLNVDADGTNATESDEQDKGDLPQIQGMRTAHLLFPRLEHLVAKYKDDGQGISAELMNLKHKHDLEHGTTHPDVKGYGPKLTRYLLGMMGSGNHIVPDRHMVRSAFDLELAPHPTKSGKFQTDPVLSKLTTQVVTDPKNEGLLRAMDHNFFVHHPAVKHVLQKFSKHFTGREAQAIFPAFWLHWLTIKHYDQARNKPHVGFNTDTDHKVFWDSVKDEMIKHGLHPHPIHEPHRHVDDDSFDFGENLKKDEHGKPLDPWPRIQNHLDLPVWMKAAGVLHALTQRWGEMPALLAHFTHVAPLMRDAETPAPPVQHVPHPAYHPNLCKAEALLIDLRKTLSEHSEKEHPALGEVAPHIQHVYWMAPGPDLKIRRHASGRFLTAGNHVHVLEDYHGHLKGQLSEGPMDQYKAQQIENLRNNHQFEVVPLSDIRSGKRPELWEAPVATPAARPTAFEYLRQGQDKADHLEYIDGKAHLNGHPLDAAQVKALLHHVKNGHATVRYSQSKGSAVRKMEALFQRLLKQEETEQAAKVNSALGKLDELVKQGLLDPQHAEALRQHAFKDPMMGNAMGNKFAYQDFLQRNQNNPEGIHLMLDANDFKSVNDKYGHETGDKAIKAMGRAVREAMDETVGQDKGKLYRIGGDEFAAHVPTHEHAAAFARALRSKLEGITPIEGAHKLSMSVGIGHNPRAADQALYEAKKQKYDPAGMTNPDSRKWVSKYAVGAAPSFAHSLVPGFEGAIPLSHEQLHVKPPPAPAPVPEAPAPVVHSPPTSAPSGQQTAMTAKPA